LLELVSDLGAQKEEIARMYQEIYLQATAPLEIGRFKSMQPIYFAFTLDHSLDHPWRIIVGDLCTPLFQMQMKKAEKTLFVKLGEQETSREVEELQIRLAVEWMKLDQAEAVVLQDRAHQGYTYYGFSKEGQEWRLDASRLS